MGEFLQLVWSCKYTIILIFFLIYDQGVEADISVK